MNKKETWGTLFPKRVPLVFLRICLFLTPTVDAGALDGDENRLVGAGGDAPLLRTLLHGDGELFALDFLRIAFALPWGLGDIDNLSSEETLRQIELFNLRRKEFVHGLRAAEIDRESLALRRILPDHIGSDKAGLKTCFLLFRENMNDPELRAFSGDDL